MSKMKRIVNVSKKVVLWYCSAVLFLLALTFLPSVESLLFLIGGVLLLPVKKVQQRIPVKRFKGTIAAALFLVGFCIIPTTPTEDATAQIPDSSPNVVEQSVADESATGIVPETVVSVMPQESTPAPTVKPTAAPTPKAKVNPENAVVNEDKSNVVVENNSDSAPVQPAPEVPATTPEPVAPTPEVTPAPQVKPQGQMVWIPQSGKKYHSHPGCSNMNNPTQVTIEKARQMGYTACKKCY